MVTKAMVTRVMPIRATTKDGAEGAEEEEEEDVAEDTATRETTRGRSGG